MNRDWGAGFKSSDWPVNFYNHLDQIINISINQSFPTFFFSHEGIIHIYMTLEVKAVLMLLIWIASVTV